MKTRSNEIRGSEELRDNRFFATHIETNERQFVRGVNIQTNHVHCKEYYWNV